MIGIAVAGGIAIGAAISLVLRRERLLQLLALGLMSLAVAVALLIAGAALPALAVLLLGTIAEVALLTPLSRPFSAGAAPARLTPAQHRTSIGVAAVAAVAATGLLIAAGIAARSALAGRVATSPSLVVVGRHFLVGAGVGVLGLLILAATVVVGASTLVQRDRREVAEEQAEAVRRRRVAEQERRAAQREAARAAARAARRGSAR